MKRRMDSIFLASVTWDFVTLKPMRKMHFGSIVYNRPKSQRHVAWGGGEAAAPVSPCLLHGVQQPHLVPRTNH